MPMDVRAHKTRTRGSSPTLGTRTRTVRVRVDVHADTFNEITPSDFREASGPVLKPIFGGKG